MFSLTYFKQLLNKDKALTISILLVTILTTIISHVKSANTLAFVLTIALSYIFPLITFKYIHNQKAVDTYYALPIKRSTLIITGLIYCVLIAYAPYFLSSILIKLFRSQALIQTELYSVSLVITPIKLLLVLVSVIGLVAFNACIYLLGNNTVDGIILLIAYTALPLVLYLTYSLFYESFVCGYYYVPSEYFIYLSPVTIATEIFNDSDHVLYEYIAIIYAVLFSCLLLLQSVKKKAEKANKISNNVLSYPLIINLYLIAVIFCCTFAYNKIYDYTTFIKENILYYLIVFVLYITFSFIYKRKFYFDIKMPIIVIGIVALSIFVSVSAFKNKGFGLSENYEEYQNETKYSMNIYKYDPSDWDIKNWIEEKTSEETAYLDIYIEAYDRNGLNKNLVNQFEKLRKQSIDEFYDENQDVIEEGYSYLSVIEKYDSNNYSSRGTRNYHVNKTNYTIDELVDMVKDGADITFYTDLKQYKLTEDGNLKLIEIKYEETVYD